MYMAKAPFRDARFDTAPVQYRDLTPDQQGVADSVMQRHFTALPGKMAATAANLQRQADNSPSETSGNAKRARASRLEEASRATSPDPVSLDQAAANRVKYVERSATDLRMPGEHMAGLGWYYNAHQEITNAVGYHPKATDVSSALSPGTNPESERASARGLIEAHANGSINFTPTLTKTLRKSGADVPQHMERQSVPFRDLPASMIPHLVNPGNAKHVEKNSSGVPWSDIKRVALPNTITKAHQILTGEVSEAHSPTGAPKTWSYAHNIASSVPGTDEHFEYMLRGADLASKIRGENIPGQQMFDYVNLRDSNEGRLSNTSHTAEDSWQQAITSDLPEPKLMKAAGDVAVTAKAHDGVSVSPDPRVGAASLRHAWENEATSRAAQQMQHKYLTEYTVPSMMIQETGWTGVRRHAQVAKGTVNTVTADIAYNEHLKAGRDEEKAQVKADKARSKQFTQLGLF